MSFGVFLLRPDSAYDDHPATRYQFPGRYLNEARKVAGGWVAYLEPSKVTETRGYFAIAEVERIIADPDVPAMWQALITAGSYIEFPTPVPFRVAGEPVERSILNDVGLVSGRRQSAIRAIPVQDFQRILSLGLPDDSAVLPRDGAMDEAPEPFLLHPEARLRQLASRAVRDRAFRRLVVDAYDRRCAVTGLRLINGGGRAEVEAAHIHPVEQGGPDTITNGIALSGTVHWMFDRGLIGLADDLTVLVSRQSNDPAAIRAMVNPSGRALLPRQPRLRPHPQFLQWHRTHCFKG